jgi:hypothetical protein
VSMTISVGRIDKVLLASLVEDSENDSMNK